MAILEDLTKQQNEELKEQKKILIEQLGQTAKDSSLSAKDRAKAARQQDQLVKGNRTLGSDISKNFTDLKDGLSTTVDGLINETFGPFGGIVSSFTTGFFKRNKENKENLTQNEIQVEQSKELLSELGGQSEVLSDQNEALTNIDENIAFMAGNQETAEDREERMRKAQAAGGEVAEPTKEEKEGFGMMLLKFLGLVLAAAAGLAVGAAQGIVKYLTDIVKLIGKPIIKLLDSIPRPKFIDDIIDMFKAEGMVGKLFTKIKTFFTGEGTFFKRISGIIDTVTDVLKGYAGGLFTKIKTFFVGEGTFFKRIAGIIDPVIDTLKGFGGGLFTKINDFFGGESSIFKRTATILDPVIDSVKGFTGGLFTKIQTFFTGETSVFKRISTLLDPIIETVKGFSGGLFTKIQNFFTGETSVFKRIGTIVDTVIDSVKGFGGKIFTTIGDIFTTLKSVGTTLMSPFKTITDVFGGTKEASGFMKTFEPFLGSVKSVFKGMASIGAKLVAPLNIIMGLFDAGFETADAVSKSEGIFAKLINGIIGAVGGFFDGAVLQLLDFIKSGISVIAGFLGFKEIETFLDSFSLSKIFNDFLDKIYAGVNSLFNMDFGALLNSVIPQDAWYRKFLPDSLFEGSTTSSEEPAEKTSGTATGAVVIPDHGYTAKPLPKQSFSLKGLSGKPPSGAASGAFIVNRPTYLPESGIIIGESKGYAGG